MYIQNKRQKKERERERVKSKAQTFGKFQIAKQGKK